ncbi:MAG: hypothetical protein WAL13_01450, partial [Trebonia sp.]
NLARRDFALAPAVSLPIGAFGLLWWDVPPQHAASRSKQRTTSALAALPTGSKIQLALKV